MDSAWVRSFSKKFAALGVGLLEPRSSTESERAGVNKAPILRLPYELQYQIFSQLIDVTVNFVFYSPTQVKEWRERTGSSHLWSNGRVIPGLERREIPCLLSLSIPEAKYAMPPACHLVSRAFTEQILSFSQDYCERLRKRLTRCLSGDIVTYIKPDAVTPEFLDCVSKGRLVFAGYVANNIPTCRTIPEAVRKAVRWVYFTRTNSTSLDHEPGSETHPWSVYRSLNLGEALPIPIQFFNLFSNIEKISMGVNQDDSYLSRWSDSMRTLYWLFKKNYIKKFEVVFEDTPASGVQKGELGVIGTRCMDWKMLDHWRVFYGRRLSGETYLWIPFLPGLSGNIMAATKCEFDGMILKAAKLNTYDLLKRGRFIRTWDPAKLESVEVLEEAVVWKLENCPSKEKQIVESLFRVPDCGEDAAYQCMCENCFKRRRERDIANMSAPKRLAEGIKDLLRLGFA
ncbi:hypothetical protein TWF694_011133 [Orbilia ellipsospora]|uniref:F-box domain-containing protein n=1 Tax=Orbilia ellipsospora TaxID=2528407 RepID=A0AAV9X842_9PEZI